MHLLARRPGDRCLGARPHPEPAGRRARPAADLLRPPRSRAIGVGAGRAMHAGSARVRRRGRATGAAARPGPRARDQLGRVSRSHVRRAPPDVDPHSGRRRRRRQSRLHGTRRRQRAPPRDRRAVGGVSRALGRLVVGRHELQARLRHDPAALLLRRAAGDRQPAAARRDPLSARGPQVHHRSRVPALRLPARARPHRVPHARRRGTPRLDLPRGPGRGDPPPDPALDAGRVRAQRPLAARRGAGGVRRRARRYFPVQRTLFSD